jgi:hypothetical protein
MDSELVGVPRAFGVLVGHLLFSCQVSECLATHSAACFRWPVHMIKLTETLEITPYVWVHPDEER